MGSLMSALRPTDRPEKSGSAEFPAAFGRFVLLRRLSRGGMGEIFLAKIGEIVGFEKFVIIKKILPQLAENDDFIVRFVDEAQVAIKLNHVNIAQVFEVGRVDGEYFLAIEYIEGRDLRRLMRRCRELQVKLPVDLCLLIARDVAAGLAYAHRRTGPKGQALALVHCDISPPNIMLSFEGEVKVIDFGIARSALRTADSNPNIGFGKFGYMAPEQLLRGGLIDRRTDIYAAGVVLYELLTGERLYQFPEGTDYRQMAREVCQGQFLLPSARDGRIDADIDAIVSKALATRAENRYQNAEEFRDALQAKLAQISPTLSSDSLAAKIDELFVGERQREQDELAQMRAVDTSALKEEIVGAVGHTVTFARALANGEIEAADATTVSPTSPEESQTVASPRVLGPAAMPPLPLPNSGAPRSQTQLTPERANRRRLPILLGLGALGLLFGGGGYYLLQSPTAKPPVVSPTPPVVPPKPVVEALPSPPPTLPPPSPPPVEVEPKPVPKPVLSAHPGGRKSGARTVTSKPQVDPAEAAAQKRLEVDRQFQAVKAEYLEFKKNFGSRLEDRWQTILSDIALGRRDQGLSDALSALRRDMKKLRTE